MLLILCSIDFCEEKVSSITSSDRKKKTPSTAGSARKKLGNASAQLAFAQVLCSNITPDAVHERKHWSQPPIKDITQTYGITLSSPTGNAVCWNFFHIIDDHNKLAKVRPDLNFKSDSTAQYQYAICNKCRDLILYRDLKSKHITSSNMTRDFTNKHKFPINGDETYSASTRNTQEGSPTKELKQQSSLNSVKKKFVFHKLTGLEVNADHQ